MKIFLKFLKGILFLMIGLILYIFISGKTYLFKAFYYTTAGIGDYQIFENRKVAIAKPEPWPLSVNYNKVKLQEDFHSRIESFEPVAFLVMHRDSIIYEEYWDGYSDTSLSNSFSMAKTITGMLTGVALRKGYIKSLDEPVGNYIESFNEGEKKKVTIRHLLTMSSGLNWDESYLNPLSVTTEAYYGNDLPKLVHEMKLIEEPGKEFKYLSGNSEVLCLVIENATGKKLANFASEEFWQKTGAEREALWSLDKENGTEKAYCCFNSNARDFARLGSLYLHDGKWNNEEIVTKEFVDLSIKPGVPLTSEGKPNTEYGYAWWLTKVGNKDIFYARGILGQYVLVDKANDLVIVRLGHKRSDAKVNNHPAEIYLYLRAAYGILSEVSIVQ